MIIAENLYKWYGSKLAVENVSFSVERGEALGFIGPNGAGKSTTMRMITGFIPASRGRIVICGHDMDSDPIMAKASIGYLPENAPLYSGMTVGGFLRFTAELRGLRGKGMRVKVDEAIQKCFLQPVRNQQIDTLSKGYKHRTCFAQAIIHDPEILILDEPTDGLDPNQKCEVRNLIKEMSRTKAIVLSTHILEEVEAVCARALVIADGKKVFDGTPDELKSLSADYGTVLIEALGPSPDELTSKFREIKGVTEASIVKLTDEGAEFRLRHSDEVSEIELRHEVFELCRAQDWLIRELKVDRGRLDEVFHSITGYRAEAGK